MLELEMLGIDSFRQVIRTAHARLGIAGMLMPRSEPVKSDASEISSNPETRTVGFGQRSSKSLGIALSKADSWCASGPDRLLLDGFTQGTWGISLGCEG